MGDRDNAFAEGAAATASQQYPSSSQQSESEEQITATSDRSERTLHELQEIRTLLWGSTIRSDVFLRWSQGFEFSDVEPSALVQKQGGPCAVIAPVQAFLLKILITKLSAQHLKDLTSDTCKHLLVQALSTILSKSYTNGFRIVTLPLVASTNVDKSLPTETTTTKGETTDGSKLFSDKFHQHLVAINLNSIEEVEQFFTLNFDDVLSAQYGVLLFLYSVLLTKGIDHVNNELLDTSESLIHSTYGYGSQALINLMLTGRAVAHVWDNDQDVGGLKLRGINEQSDIGFITLMEQMRYCTVGSFYKNPRYPVWVMGSETHLTVLFSFDKRLVSPETPSEIARRIFKSFDPDGNNFISSSVLQDVLAALDLVNEPEYVDIMQKRLDPEGLGIILLNSFMDEFFPLERCSTPDSFEIMHYNGISGSNTGNKVRYCKGSAVLLESDIKSVCPSNPIMTCLQTKWPNIDITWHDSLIPSLN